MKENELYIECEIGLDDPVAVRIIGSSEIAKAIIRKAGHVPEPAYPQKDKCVHPKHDEISRNSDPILSGLYIDTKKGSYCEKCWAYTMGKHVDKHTFGLD
jgi:hypothetical protein